MSRAAGEASAGGPPFRQAKVAAPLGLARAKRRRKPAGRRRRAFLRAYRGRDRIGQRHRRLVDCSVFAADLRDAPRRRSPLRTRQSRAARCGFLGFVALRRRRHDRVPKHPEPPRARHPARVVHLADPRSGDRGQGGDVAFCPAEEPRDLEPGAPWRRLAPSFRRDHVGRRLRRYHLKEAATHRSTAFRHHVEQSTAPACASY